MTVAPVSLISAFKFPSTSRKAAMADRADGFVALPGGFGTLVEVLEIFTWNQIGAIACYRETAVVIRLPKTRSGKILRGTMRSIAGGKEYRMPSTIDDPTILDEITEDLKKMGYPEK